VLRRWLPLLPFALACAVVIGLSAAQQQGMIADAPRIDFAPLPRLWPSIALLLLAAALITAMRVPPMIALPPAWVAVLLGLGLSLVAVWLLRAFPSSSDEYAYLFQAETFLRGRLWNPVLPAQEFLHFNHLFEKDGKWVSQYAPGWAALLALVELARLPVWLAAPLLGALLLLATHRLGADAGDAAAGRLAALLLAVSAFFAFNAGSFFNHAPAALFIVLACLLVARFLDRPRLTDGLLAGAALGLLGLLRTFDVVVLAVPIGLAFLLRARAPHYLRAPAIVLGGLPFLIALLLYQHAITGNALLPVTNWGYPLFRMGLYGMTEWGEMSSPGRSLQTTLAHLVDLADWTSPLLALAAPVVPILLWRAGTLRFHDLVFPALVAGFLFFPDIGGDQYGPRYWFDAVPLLMLSIARAGLDLAARAERWRHLLTGLLYAHVTIAVAGLGVIGYWMRIVADGRRDIYTVVERARLDDAVVIVGAWTGRVRAMTPDGLTRNGVDATGAVLYVLDLAGRRDELKALFPGRRRYLYERPGDVLPGRLTPLD
jgi:hypothetical protein